MAKLDHPNILRCYGGNLQGCPSPFIVTELCECSLDKVGGWGVHWVWMGGGGGDPGRCHKAAAHPGSGTCGVQQRSNWIQKAAHCDLPVSQQAGHPGGAALQLLQHTRALACHA